MVQLKKGYYQYDPSLAAAAIFATLFALTSLFHTYQIVRTKAWFWIPFLVGGIFEFFGFVARAVNASQDAYTWGFGAFIVQTLGLLLAPVFFAASIYMALGRIAMMAGAEDKLIVRRTWLTKIFVGGDVLAFLVQVMGGTMLTSQKIDTMNLGRKIILVGLWLQIIFFCFFILNAILFFVRMRSSPSSTPWTRHLTTLLVASFLILARCIYRVIEYNQGHSGYLITHEVFVYVLDSGLMLLVMLIFHFVHPSEIGARLNGGKMAVLFKVTDVSKAYQSYESTEELGVRPGRV